MGEPPDDDTRNNADVRSQLARSHRPRPLGTPTASPACEPPAAIHFSSRARSLAVCHRSSGSFARQFLTAWSSAGGVIGFAALIGSGSFSKIADATLN